MHYSCAYTNIDTMSQPDYFCLSKSFNRCENSQFSSHQILSDILSVLSSSTETDYSGLTSPFHQNLRLCIKLYIKDRVDFSHLQQRLLLPMS